MLGGALGATALLFHQELLESAGGEGESLPPQLHKVGVLQPGLCEAVSRSRTGPENTDIYAELNVSFLLRVSVKSNFVGAHQG